METTMRTRKKAAQCILSVMLALLHGQAGACTLGREVLVEVTNPGITHIKGMYGIEDTTFTTFFVTSSIPAGVYEVNNPSEEYGYWEVAPGVWVEERFGCYSGWSYDVFVWNGFSGAMCSEDAFDPNTQTCQ